MAERQDPEEVQCNSFVCHSVIYVCHTLELHDSNVQLCWLWERLEQYTITRLTREMQKVLQERLSTN